MKIQKWMAFSKGWITIFYTELLKDYKQVSALGFFQPDHKAFGVYHTEDLLPFSNVGKPLCSLWILSVRGNAADSYRLPFACPNHETVKNRLMSSIPSVSAFFFQPHPLKKLFTVSFQLILLGLCILSLYGSLWALDFQKKIYTLLFI